MNRTTLPVRLAAFALALVVNASLLLGMDGLATSEAPPQLLAKVGLAHKA